MMNFNIFSTENVWRWYPWIPFVDSDTYHYKEKLELELINKHYKDCISDSIPGWFILDTTNRKPININKDLSFSIPSQKQFQMQGEIAFDFYPILVNIRNFQIKRIYSLGNHYINEPLIQALEELKIWIINVSKETYTEKICNEISRRIRYLLLLSGEQVFNINDRNFLSIISHDISKIESQISTILNKASTKKFFQKLKLELKIAYEQSIHLIYYIFKENKSDIMFDKISINDIISVKKNDYLSNSRHSFYEDALISGEISCKHDASKSFSTLYEKYLLSCKLVFSMPNFIRQITHLESMGEFGGDVLIYVYLNNELKQFLNLLLKFVIKLNETFALLEDVAKKTHQEYLDGKHPNLKHWDENYMHLIKEDISPMNILKSVTNTLGVLQINLYERDLHQKPYWNEVTEAVNNFRNEINLLSDYFDEKNMITYLPDLITNFVENKKSDNTVLRPFEKITQELKEPSSELFTFPGAEGHIIISDEEFIQNSDASHLANPISSLLAMPINLMPDLKTLFPSFVALNNDMKQDEFERASEMPKDGKTMPNYQSSVTEQFMLLRLGISYLTRWLPWNQERPLIIDEIDILNENKTKLKVLYGDLAHIQSGIIAESHLFDEQLNWLDKAIHEMKQKIHLTLKKASVTQSKLDDMHNKIIKIKEMLINLTIKERELLSIEKQSNALVAEGKRYAITYDCIQNILKFEIENIEPEKNISSFREAQNTPFSQQQQFWARCKMPMLIEAVVDTLPTATAEDIGRLPKLDY
jgi:hypothetical protein